MAVKPALTDREFDKFVDDGSGNTAVRVMMVPLDPELEAVAGLTSDGIMVKTGPGAITTRTIQAGSGIIVTNGDGISADPNVAVTPDGITASLLASFGGATKAVVTDASGKPTVSATTAAEIAFVSGVTSAIQTQINSKEPTITVLPISKGGTNSGAALSNNRIMQSSGGAIVEAAAITASRALASNASGIPVAATTTSAELDFVSGVTSGIQAQINGKQATGSYITALTGDVTATGPGSSAATLANSGVTAGTYHAPSELTVDAKGRITSVSEGPFNQRKFVYLFDDFISGLVINNAALGNICWSEVNAGAGAVVTFGGFATTTDKAHGVAISSIGTAGTGRDSMSLGTNQLGLGFGTLSIEYRINIPIVSDGTNTYGAIWGFGDTTGIGHQQANGIYFRHDSSVSANWILETANGSVRTSTISGTAVTAATWVRLRIDVNAGGTSAEYFINDSSVGTVTTNLPTVNTAFFSPIFKCARIAGGTTRNLYTDYMMLKLAFTSDR